MTGMPPSSSGAAIARVAEDRVVDTTTGAGVRPGRVRDRVWAGGDASEKKDEGLVDETAAARKV